MELPQISQRIKAAILIAIGTIIFTIIALFMTGAGVVTQIDFYLNSVFVAESQGFNAIEGSGSTITAVQNGTRVDYTFTVSGAGISDTSAATECIGTTTYLDGEGNCDTLDGLEDFETATDDTLLIGNGVTFDSKVLSDCDDTAGNHLNYDITTNAFSCGTSASGYSTIDDEDTPLTQRTTLNFAGAGVTCADDVTQTTCTIGGGASQNLFETINAPLGTDPVADSPTDTLNLTSQDGSVTITGDSSVDEIDFSIEDTNAGTICAGDTTYLDGDGNCDNVVDTSAETECIGTSTYLDGEGNCDTGIFSTVIFKTTDETINNSTTLQFDDEITFTGQAGEIYGFSLIFIYKSSTVADIKMSFDCVAVDVDLLWRPTGSLNSGIACQDGGGIFLGGTGVTQADRMVFAFDGFVEFINLDTLTLQWAQQTLEASNTTVSRGTSLKLWRLNP